MKPIAILSVLLAILFLGPSGRGAAAQDAEKPKIQAAEKECPACKAKMKAFENEGIQWDQCGKCEGVFFSKGELERLLRRVPGPTGNLLKQSSATQCASNMSLLIKTTYHHSLVHMQPEGSFPKIKGPGFWEKVVADMEAEATLLVCPTSKQSYPGPNVEDINTAGLKGIMTFCVHEKEVNICTKSGFIKKTEVDSDEHKRAIKETAAKPKEAKK